MVTKKVQRFQRFLWLAQIVLVFPQRSLGVSAFSYFHQPAASTASMVLAMPANCVAHGTTVKRVRSTSNIMAE